jgi:short-subunit dehydrogenase
MKKTASNTQTGNGSSFALITGASRGLGKEIARELALKKFNLLLVSLKDEGLPELCSEMETKYGVNVYYLEADLSESQAVFQVTVWALSKGPVSILINNAGIGGTSAYDVASAEYIDSIIQLNIRATSLLTRLILPELKCQKQAFILNVASMASFSPIAYKTVYPASKAFIWSFSRGLNEELKGTGVFVSVIHPGPMKTNSEVIKRIEKQKFFGRMGLVTTEKIAKIAVNNLLKHDSLIIPGFINKLNWLMIRIVPVWLRLNLLSRVIKRELKEEQFELAVKIIN